MQWTRQGLKERAKVSLRSFYWKSVLAAGILSLISGNVSVSSNGTRTEGMEPLEQTGNEWADALGGMLTGPIRSVLALGLLILVVAVILALLLDIFVFKVIEVGGKRYFLKASEGTAELSNLGCCFRNNYMNVVTVQFLTNLSIGLWSLLLVIPGIVKAYEYRMIPFLLAEDPDLSFSQAKELSQQMMAGEKWNTFVLDLSFFLWELLSALTLSLVGIFWVAPYKQFTDTELYKVLRTRVPGPYYRADAPDMDDAYSYR